MSDSGSGSAGHDETLVLSAEALRQRHDEKWQRYPPDVLPAFVADMDFAVAGPVQRAIAGIVNQQDYGYPWRQGSDRVEVAFVHHMIKRHGWVMSPDRVRVTTDVMQGIAACLLAFTEPGDGVVVQTPIYPPFFRVIRSLGRRIVENPLIDTGERFVLDVDGLKNVTNERTRILLLCNPHNPTGRVFEPTELAALRNLAVERDLIIVSDEIHADLLYPGRQHVAVGSLDPAVAERTVTLSSATKAFNLAALKCAVAHFGSDQLKNRFDQFVPMDLRGHVTNISMDAAVAAWYEGLPWLEQVIGLLCVNRSFIVSWLAREMPQVRCYAPEATYMAWLDCRELRLPGPSPLDFFLDRARVALKGGLDFGPTAAGFVRLNFATSREILEAILGRMLDAVNRYAA